MQVFNWNVVHLPVADDGLHLLNLADDNTLKWLEYITLHWDVHWPCVHRFSQYDDCSGSAHRDAPDRPLRVYVPETDAHTLCHTSHSVHEMHCRAVPTSVHVEFPTDDAARQCSGWSHASTIPATSASAQLRACTSAAASCRKRHCLSQKSYSLLSIIQSHKCTLASSCYTLMYEIHALKCSPFFIIKSEYNNTHSNTAI